MRIPKYYKIIQVFLTYLFLILLSACSKEYTSPKEEITTAKATADSQPIALSPELFKIYQTTCSHCHSQTATGAPQTGDVDAWRKVLAKGIDASLERAMMGSGGMPPAGQCFECTPEDILALIHFMSAEQEG